MGNLVSTTINQDDSYTDSYSVVSGGLPVFIWTKGTWQGTISIQIKVNGQSDFEDIPEEKYNLNFSAFANLPLDGSIRVGFKAGDYTSGSITIYMTQ
jgi:hypothetical protein